MCAHGPLGPNCGLEIVHRMCAKAYHCQGLNMGSTCPRNRVKAFKWQLNAQNVITVCSHIIHAPTSFFFNERADGKPQRTTQETQFAPKRVQHYTDGSKWRSPRVRACAQQQTNACRNNSGQNEIGLSFAFGHILIRPHVV